MVSVMNQERIPSNYKVGLDEVSMRVAIMRKDTGEAVETFADRVPEELLITRMAELREDEIMRTKLVQGTSLEGTSQGGDIFVPPSFNDMSTEHGDLII
jgi:hypothetical protein